MATIRAHDHFDVKADCKKLHALLTEQVSKAASRARERALIEILGARSYGQRQDIVYTYREFYGRYLAQDIRSVITGPFRDGLLTLIRPYGVRDATAVHKALTGLGIDEHTLIEVICSRDWEQLQDMSACYAEAFRQDLAKTIKSELSGKFQMQVMKLLRERRSEAPLDVVRAGELVRGLHEAAYGMWGKNKMLILDVLTRESLAQLRHVIRLYEIQFGETVHTMISRVFSGDLRKLVSYLAMYVESETAFYACMLRKAASGGICDKSALHKAVMGHSSEIAAFMRIILTRCDIDLQSIIAFYEKTYGLSLKDDICMNTTGDLRNLLMAACGWQWPVCSCHV